MSYTLEVESTAQAVVKGTKNMMYELRIKGEQSTRFEARTMIALLRLASMYYHDWWFVHDRSDLSELMNEYDGEPASEFKQKLGRCISSIKQGYTVLFGDRNARFKPEQLETVDDVVKVMKRALLSKEEYDFEIVEVK